ncbi:MULTISPECIES: hypothetical protein [unclassified Mesorhizobium]|uniref:hypothetical protein n=1 Tax=unclassified Mesorhizobium TaxID=325217 RepID=UPI001128A47B|nr:MULTISPECIES: hypothetical protein [unclassified Mesorhizobium]TPJ70480.1 hypothetical protein FJ462_07235 [Mesorhizobium sp. B2-6-7]TPJ76863.1 hypothetical protein FJ422_29585 [Mesorhizobium sp. B2-6-3]
MTTSQSPLRVLKAQADKIAAVLKAAERGDHVGAEFAGNIAAAREKPSFKTGIVMDDKVVTIDMPWATIKASSEVGLSEYILKQMRGSREATH